DPGAWDRDCVLGVLALADAAGEELHPGPVGRAAFERSLSGVAIAVEARAARGRVAVAVPVSGREVVLLDISLGNSQLAGAVLGPARVGAAVIGRIRAEIDPESLGQLGLVHI